MNLVHPANEYLAMWERCPATPIFALRPACGPDPGPSGPRGHPQALRLLDDKLRKVSPMPSPTGVGTEVPIRRTNRNWSPLTTAVICIIGQAGARGANGRTLTSPESITTADDSGTCTHASLMSDNGSETIARASLEKRCTAG